MRPRPVPGGRWRTWRWTAWSSRRLAAGHVQPREAAAGQDGDMDAVHEVLFAAASLSRM